MGIMTEEQPIVYGNDLYSVALKPGLSEAEQKEAEDILRWIKGPRPFYGIAGLMLVTGDPRQGKGLFTNTLGWKIGYYFDGIRVVRDDLPGPAFGEYTLFDEAILSDDLGRMKEIAKAKNNGNGSEADTVEKGKTTESWVTETGSVLFHKAVALYDEYWRYMNNRRGMAEMNVTLGGLNKMWGHTETLHVGIVQWSHDLDRYTCLPWVTHEVRCKWSTTRPNTVEAHLYYVKYNRASGRLITLNNAPIRIYVDGAKERPHLGIRNYDEEGNPHYYRYFDLFISKSAPVINMRKSKYNM